MKLITYSDALKFGVCNMVALNNIHTIDTSFDGYLNSRMSSNIQEQMDNDGYYTEVYNYFITDCTDDDVEYLVKGFSDMWFAYSDLLDAWVLLQTVGGRSGMIEDLRE